VGKVTSCFVRQSIWEALGGQEEIKYWNYGKMERWNNRRMEKREYRRQETGGLQEKRTRNAGGWKEMEGDLRKHLPLTGCILISNLTIISLQTDVMKGVKYADIEGIQN
jgi:hypothetical protein